MNELAFSGKFRYHFFVKLLFFAQLHLFKVKCDTGVTPVTKGLMENLHPEKQLFRLRKVG